MLKFLAILVLCILGTFSLPRGEQKDCPYDTGCACTPIHCDIEPSFLKLINYYVDKAVDKFGEKNLCSIADDVRAQLSNLGYTNLVVLVGSNALFTSSYSYASRFDYNPKTYVRFQYKSKLSIEVYSAIGNTQINDKPTRMVANKTETNISPQIMDPQYPETDIKGLRFVLFDDLINRAFDGNHGVLQDTVDQIFNEIPCTGHWVVVAALKSLLTKKQNTCASYNHFTETRYLGSFKQVQSDDNYIYDVLVFAPRLD